MDNVANGAASFEQALVDRKTQTILSQDNQRSQKVLDSLNKLPLQVIRNSTYQDQIQRTLNSRPQTFSVENLQSLNQTAPLTALAARYTTQVQASSNPLTKTLLNKVGDPQSRLTQQTPLGSSTSTEMRYLSAKSAGAANAVNASAVLKKGQSRNIPQYSHKSHTAGKTADMKITILPSANGGGAALIAGGGQPQSNKRGVGLQKAKSNNSYNQKPPGS